MPKKHDLSMVELSLQLCFTRFIEMKNVHVQVPKVLFSWKIQKTYICKGYFLAPPSAACFSAAFFCFSLIIAASLNRMKETINLSEEKKIIISFVV